MSGITAEFVQMVARVWHRIALEDAEADGIAKFLAPMDDAAEAAAERLDFDSEPADFERMLEDIARER